MTGWTTGDQTLRIVSAHQNQYTTAGGPEQGQYVRIHGVSFDSFAGSTRRASESTGNRLLGEIRQSETCSTDSGHGSTRIARFRLHKLRRPHIRVTRSRHPIAAAGTPITRGSTILGLRGGDSDSTPKRHHSTPRHFTIQTIGHNRPNIVQEGDTSHCFWLLTGINRA